MQHQSPVEARTIHVMWALLVSPPEECYTYAITKLLTGSGRHPKANESGVLDVLKRLTEWEWVRRCEESPTARETKRKCVYYHLTPLGEEAFIAAERELKVRIKRLGSSMDEGLAAIKRRRSKDPESS